MTDTTVTDAPPVFNSNGQLQGNLTSSQGEAPSSVPSNAPVPPPPMQKLPGQLEGLNADMQKAHEHEQAALLKPMSALSTAYAGRPQMGQQQSLGPAPDAKDYQKNSMEFASAMAVLGAVASKFTRASGGAALSAFAGALNGWKSGNLEAYENAAKKWEQDTKTTIENNRQILEKYKLALENRQMNIDEQMSQIQLIAAQYHDQIMYDMAAAKNFTGVAQVYEKNWEYTNGPKGIEATSAPLMATRRKEEEQQALMGERVASGQINPDGLNPQTGQPYSETEKAYLKYTKGQYLSGFYGAAGSAKAGGKIAGGLPGQLVSKENQERADRGESPMTAQEEINFVQKIRPPRSGPARALQKFMDENPEATSNDLQAFVARQAGASSEERAVGQRAGAIAIAVDEAHKTVPNVLAAAEKSAGKGLATWNAVENRWKIEKGDADFAYYVQQINSLINVYGRVISGGGKGTVSDLEHAREMLNPNMPLSAVRGSLKGFSTEIDIAEKAPGEARAKMRGGSSSPVPGLDNQPALAGGSTDPLGIR